MYGSQEKHEQVLNSRITLIRTKLQKLNNKVSSIQEMKTQKDEDLLNELIDKTKEKEKKHLELAKSKERITAQRMARIRARNDTVKGITKKIQSAEESRVSNLQERLKRVEERIGHQKVS